MPSVIPFISNLHILDKSGVDHRFGDVISAPQLDLLIRIDDNLLDRKPSRFIVLKARQVGMSTAIEALQYTLAMSRQNFRGLVIAHENDSSKHLLNMSRYFYDTFWARAAYPTKYAAQNQLAWQFINSHIRIATAKNEKAGRSTTLQFLHASEVAFWDNADTLMTGLEQSIGRRPGTFIFFESTANGVGGYFYNTWEEATTGRSIYQPLFYPWWSHPEYTAHHIDRGHLAEGTLVFADDEEKALYRMLSQTHKVNDRRYERMDDAEIKSRLIWRREILATECRGDINKLHQEFPSDPEEAFIATGTNVFDLEKLKKVYEPLPSSERGRLVNEGTGVRFIPDPNGELEVYKFPSERREFGHYMIGGDPKKAVSSNAKTPGDYCCAQVLNRKTWEQVAEWRGRADQNHFGEVMILLGRWYNNAVLAPESGVGGPGTAAHIIAKGYPHVFMHRKSNNITGQADKSVGWITNNQTKPEAIGNLQSAIFDATQEPAYGAGIGIRIHSAQLYKEMKDYTVLADGQFGNADGQKGHDDTVMAMAIALSCTKLEALAMLNDDAYQAPRYHDLDYQSTLQGPADIQAFEGHLAAQGVGEGSVMTKDGLMQGEGFDVPWIEDETPDFFGSDEEY